MLNFDHYYKLEWDMLHKAIDDKLSKGESFRITFDGVIREKEDIKRPVFHTAIKKAVNLAARRLFEKASIADVRMVMPKEGAKINGIVLEEGIIIPVYAAGVVEDTEFTDAMVIMGLIMILKKRYDEYYLKLLRSYRVKFTDQDVLQILAGTYWKNKVDESVSQD